MSTSFSSVSDMQSRGPIAVETSVSRVDRLRRAFAGAVWHRRSVVQSSLENIVVFND